MIYVGTKLKIIDNSGARQCECIRVLGNSKVGYVGSLIIVAIKKAFPAKKVKKGEVYKALVTNTKKGVKRLDGTYLFFKENTAVLLDPKDDLLGTRILEPVSLAIRFTPNVVISKILTLSPTAY